MPGSSSSSGGSDCSVALLVISETFSSEVHTSPFSYCLCAQRAHVYTHVPQHAQGSQKSICKNGFSPTSEPRGQTQGSLVGLTLPVVNQDHGDPHDGDAPDATEGSQRQSCPRLSRRTLQLSPKITRILPSMTCTWQQLLNHIEPQVPNL